MMNGITTITLSKSEKAMLRRAEKWAVEMIREKVDMEKLYDAEALYESTGEQLRDYLAYAFMAGRATK